MGIACRILLSDQHKPDYTVAAVAAGAFTIPAGELVIWVGDEVSQHTALSAIKRCGEAIREAGNPIPDELENCAAVADASGLKSHIEISVGAAPVAAESDVIVGYGELFNALPGGSVTPFVKRATEKLLEQHFKKVG